MTTMDDLRKAMAAAKVIDRGQFLTEIGQFTLTVEKIHAQLTRKGVRSLVCEFKVKDAPAEHAKIVGQQRVLMHMSDKEGVEGRAKAMFAAIMGTHPTEITASQDAQIIELWVAYMADPAHCAEALAKLGLGPNPFGGLEVIAVTNPSTAIKTGKPIVNVSWRPVVK